MVVGDTVNVLSYTFYYKWNFISHFFFCKIKMKNFPEKYKKITLINHPNQDTFRPNCSVPKSCLTLWHHRLQHAKFPCPSLSPGVCSDWCLLSQWCHPTISSSVAPLSSCSQCFPASSSFPMSQLFISGGQSIGASASASVLPMNIQDWFPLGMVWFPCCQRDSR